MSAKKSAKGSSPETIAPDGLAAAAEGGSPNDVPPPDSERHGQTPESAQDSGSAPAADPNSTNPSDASESPPPVSVPAADPVPLPDGAEAQEILISPFRKEVVTLANQLVTAQIAASAQLAAANGLASAIKKIAAEFLMASARINSDLETLGKNPELIEAAFVDRAYAQLLGAVDPRIPVPTLLEPLDNAELDRLFNGALARAQQLLRSPLEDATLIHAEQLFNPTERMVESAVGKRFEEWKWPLLENWDTCYKLMVRIERWFSEHLDELHADDETWDDDSRRLQWFLTYAREKPSDDLSRKIFDLVATHDGPPPDAGQRPLSFENFTAAVWRDCVVWVLFSSRIPKPRSKKDGKMTRHYRPWGLFRYLRLFGDCN